MIISQAKTAIDCYHDFVNSGAKVKQQDKVYKALELLTFASDMELSKFTGIECRSIGARRSELCAENKVVEAGIREDKVTGKDVQVWKVNPNPSPFATKKISTQKRMKLLRELAESNTVVLSADVLRILNS